ncbi:MAG: pyridoxamine 5'-phosphate oxidase family protein, partial [Spirosomataceae bacterium]
MALILPQHQLEEIPQIIFAELRKGTVQKKHPFRNVVFGTVAEKHPKSRWVVFRKLTENQRFLIFTDSRSGKAAELKKNNSCSLLFY